MLPDQTPKLRRLARLMLGSTNRGKILAAQRAIADPLIAAWIGCEALLSVAAESGVSDNPVGFAQTAAGAANRARAAWAKGRRPTTDDAPLTTVWGLGIESGSVPLLPETGTHFHFDVACVFDGAACHFGVSSGCEYPARLCRAVFEQGQDFQAARAYISTVADLSERGGVIGLLTAGVSDRIQTAQQAARLALIRAADPTGCYDESAR